MFNINKGTVHTHTDIHTLCIAWIFENFSQFYFFLGESRSSFDFFCMPSKGPFKIVCKSVITSDHMMK